MSNPPIFDVPGIHGASGISGYSHWHPPTGYGDYGQRGGNGTGGKDGSSAGTISVRLTTPTTTANIPENVVLPNPIDVDVKLDAYIAQAAGQLQKMDTVLKINSWESMSFLAVGGTGGNGGNGGNGQDGGTGYRYGASLLLSFNESISEYAWRTAALMQLDSARALMAVLVATEEMGVMQVKAAMVDLEEPFESLFPKPTLISFGSVTEVLSIILAEARV
jgi:hypothetical protein